MMCVDLPRERERDPSPRLKWVFRGRTVGALLLAASLAAGCSAPPQRVVHTFDRAPTGWLEWSERGEGPAAGLRVESGRLVLAGERALLDPTPLCGFAGRFDVALTGGRAGGIAGIFLAAEGSSVFEVLALRSTTGAEGEWRRYRSANPLRPRGGLGWQPLEGTPAGYRRIEVREEGGEAVFRIDGREVDRSALDAGSSSAAPRPPRWRVGLFAGEDTECRWKSFIAGESRPGQEFDPSLHEDWGTIQTARALAAELRSRVDAYQREPSVMGVYALAASLDGALRASRQAGDAALADALRSQAEEAADRLQSAARRAGASELMRIALASLIDVSIEGVEADAYARKAEEAASRGLAGEALAHLAIALTARSDAGWLEELQNLKKSLPPLVAGLAVETSDDAQEIVSARSFAGAVRSLYGSLRRGGGVEIDLRIERSAIDESEEPAVRRVPVTGAPGLGARLIELKRLETQIQEEVQDAIVRARVLRECSEYLGRQDSEMQIRKVRIGEETHELTIDDGRRISEMHDRLSDLRRRLEAASSGGVRYEEVDAVRRIVSIAVVFSVAVRYEGEALVRPREHEIYRGIDQWKHAAIPSRGVEASRFHGYDDEVESVRRRVLRRFATEISLQSLMSRMSDDEERLQFLIRLARSARTRDSIDELKLFLQSKHDLTADRRDKAVDLLMK